MIHLSLTFSSLKWRRSLKFFDAFKESTALRRILNLYQNTEGNSKTPSSSLVLDIAHTFEVFYSHLFQSIHITGFAILLVEERRQNCSMSAYMYLSIFLMKGMI